MKFNDENEWGIQVITESHADASVILEDITVASDSGDLPDLVAVEPFVLQLLLEQGMTVQDLTQFIDSSQWGFSDLEMNEIPLAFLEADQAGGIQMGFPASRTGYVIFYNQSWAKELGFSQIPTTIGEFRDQACAAASAVMKDRNDGTGGFLYQDSPEALLSWMHAFGGGVMDKSSNGMVFNSKENSMALEFIFDLYHSDCAWVSFEQSPYRYFAERYALFYSGNLQDINKQVSYNQASGSKDDWTIIPYPSLSVELKPTMLLDGYSYGILGDDPQKALASWILVKYLLEAENQIEQVEQTSEFPINMSNVNRVDSFSIEFPIWQQAVKLLPMADNIPNAPEWGVAKSLLKDIADKDILFFTDKESFPELLGTADSFMLEMEKNP